MKSISRTIIGTFFGACLATQAADKKPNIIFLLADDQSRNSIGIYGNDEVVTPQMDKLGNDGLTFDLYYNTTAICMASRANILTGKYEYKHGTNFGYGFMKPEIWAKSYPILLREAGYLTAFAGKFGIGVEGKGRGGLCQNDFDMWGGAPGQSSYSTAKNKSMAKYAEEFPHSTLSYGAFGRDVIREAVKKDVPFCLSISFKAPHHPTTPDPRFDHIYRGKTFTKPKNFGREAGEHFSEHTKLGRQYERFESWGYADRYDEVMATYYQQIYGIDVALGMIRDELDAQGVTDNTVVIYTSDNGFFNGAHGYGSKVLPMEESTLAPLMIYDPRHSNAGKKLRSNTLSGNIDIAPTILDLAGLPAPEDMDGKSLLPVLDDPEVVLRESLALFNFWGGDTSSNMTIVGKGMKYTYWWYGSDKLEPAEDLFHLTRDPLEMTNFKNDPEYKEHFATMKQLYDDQLEVIKVDMIDNPKYERFKTNFDRTIPWQEKIKPRPSAESDDQAGKKGKAKGKKKAKTPPTN